MCYVFLFWQGRAVFASGSPFDPYTLPDGKQLVPGQGNNAYVFPGVALGVTTFGVRHISDDIFLEAAKVSKFRLQSNVIEKREGGSISSWMVICIKKWTRP